MAWNETSQKPVQFAFDARTAAKAEEWQYAIGYPTKHETARRLATICIWGFDIDDHHDLMRLTDAHQLRMKMRYPEFGRVCAVARYILGGDQALIVQVAECLESLPAGFTYEPETLEAVAARIAGVELSEAQEVAMLAIHDSEYRQQRILVATKGDTDNITGAEPE